MRINYPKISIVTPNYNQDHYLEKAIRSILDQEYPNLEYIIMDGGSIDKSVYIIEKYKSKLAYWISEKDNGMYDAINKGLQKTTGEIMGWLNSDDMLVPGSLYTLAEIFNNIEVEWVQGQQTLFDAQGRIYYSKPPDLRTKWEYLLKYYHHSPTPFIQQESTYWRRSLWLKAGGYVSTEYKLAGDFELWMRFFKHRNMFITNSLIGGFRVHGMHQKSIKDQMKYLTEADQIVANYRISEQEKMALDLLQRNKFVDRVPFLRRKRFQESRKYRNDYRQINWYPKIGKFKVG